MFATALRWTREHKLSLLVLVVLVAGSFGAFTVSRRVVHDQEKRLLSERAGEVSALLTNFIGSIDSSLRVLGPIGASQDPSAAALFTQSAAPLLKGNTKTVAVAVDRGDGFTVVAAVGDGLAVGEELAAARAALVGRAAALDAPQLVSDLVSEGGETRLLLAMRVEGTQAVTFQESVVNAGQPAPSTPESPFRELRVVLYASPRVDPDRLLVTTEAQVPLVGPVEQVSFPVGADEWLLAVGARGSLVGSFAQTAPWLFLGVGLATALLATAIVETLTRRRAYALALVAERTGELEQALCQLAETSAFLERLFLAGPVVIGRARVSDQVVTYVSPNVERILDLRLDDVSKPGFLARGVHPDDMAAFGAAMGRLARGASDQEVLEYRFRTGEGAGEDAFRWIEATMVPETDDFGQVVAVLAYIVDVDDRRWADQRRQELREAAELANQAKSEFLSRMSHELRTPLNAVLGFGQLLALEELTPEQADNVKQITHAGRHLLGLIDEVLDITRIESGQLRLSLESVRLADVVDEATRMVQPLATSSGVRLTAAETLGDHHVGADRQRIKQVVVNLLANAVKYNRPGGEVRVSCEADNDGRVRLVVSDTGIGIAEQHLHRLFMPFERLGADQTDVEGTGLGLALSKHLVEAMGGEIGVTSEVGVGSSFWVELTVADAPEQQLTETPKPAAAPERRSSTGPRTVLYIEDNLSNVKLLERVVALRPELTLLVAMQGRLGLDLAREHRPALILLDLHLPDISGEEVLGRLRAEPPTATTPVVMLSADATEGQVRRLMDLGATAYLTKPFDIPRLLAVLDGEAPDEQPTMPAEPTRDVVAESLAPGIVASLRELGRGSEEAAAGICDLIETFLDRSEALLVDLQAAVQDGDAVRAKQLAHSLAGASANVGAQRVAELCREIEAKARTGDLRGAAIPLTQLDEAFPVACVALRAEFLEADDLLT